MTVHTSGCAVRLRSQGAGRSPVPVPQAWVQEESPNSTGRGAG